MKIEDFIDILDSSKPLNKELIDEAERNPEVKEAIEDINCITDILHEEQLNFGKEEVQQRLLKFQQRHKDQGHVAQTHLAPSTHKFSRAIKLGLSIAAASTLILLMVMNGKQKETTAINIDGNGVLSATDTHQSSTSDIADTSLPNNIHEQVIDNKQIAKIAAQTDTIQLNVSNGNSCKVILSDGSCAYLHPGSKLKYPHHFNGKERRVMLEGEAYFIVQKDSKHPFIVEANNSEALVTGTQFNVAATAAKKVQVTLINGSVIFGEKNTDKKVSLTPGRQALLSDSHINVCDADTMQYVAWRDGYIYFDDATLGEILQQISQSYNVAVTCSNSQLLNYRMHLILSREKNLDEVIEIINKMKKVKISMQKGKLHVDANVH